MLVLVVTEGVAIAVLALLVAGLLRNHADILRSLHDLGAGVEPGGDPRPVHASRVASLRPDEVAHDLTGIRLDGTAVAVSVVGVPRDSLLAFLSSGCMSCRPFWDALRFGATLPPRLRAVVVVQEEDSRQRLRELAGDDLDVVVSSAAWSAYGVPGSPHIVLVDGPTGRVVGEGTGQDLEQVLDLLAHAGEHRADGPSPPDPRDNADRIDKELAAFGIGPGHPSLQPQPER